MLLVKRKGEEARCQKTSAGRLLAGQLCWFAGSNLQTICLQAKLTDKFCNN